MCRIHKESRNFKKNNDANLGNRLKPELGCDSGDYEDEFSHMMIDPEVKRGGEESFPRTLPCVGEGCTLSYNNNNNSNAITRAIIWQYYLHHSND